MQKRQGNPPTILHGAPLAQSLFQSLLAQRTRLSSHPHLLLITDHTPAADAYERQIRRWFQKLDFTVSTLDATRACAEVTSLTWNTHEIYDGVLVLRPLKNRTLEKLLQASIAPEKDVDAYGWFSLGRLYEQNVELAPFLPCAVEAVLRFLDFYHIEVNEKRICLFGASPHLGAPLATRLWQRGAIIDVVRRQSSHPQQRAQAADILISTMGNPAYIDDAFVHDHQIIIDVGCSEKEGKLVGDVAFTEVKDRVAAITPVPGGIGQLTPLVLAEHLWLAHLRKEVYETK